MKIKYYILITIISLFVAGCARRSNLQLLQSPMEVAPNKPYKIALLVPLHGSLRGSGEAVRNGFLSAYYNAQEQMQSNISIKIMDTSRGNIEALYQQVKAQKVDFIVGPLTKKNVQVLAKHYSLDIPVLALNTVDNYKKEETANLYQYGLSSQDEAIQAANKAWQDHPGRAIIIAPKGSWGDGLANAVQNTWTSSGGMVTAILSYNKNANLGPQIEYAFNVNSSQKNAAQLRYTLGEKFRFIPRRRQDVDVIFLIAAPEQARQIKPLLDFYFAGDIPVYATSTIYSGFPQPSLDRDLNGIIFCDSPWVLQKPDVLPDILPEIRDKVITLWLDSYKRYNRLYALGIDAYYLVLNLHRLAESSNIGLRGASGILSLDQYNHIYRQLDWAQMQNGIPYLL